MPVRADGIGSIRVDACESPGRRRKDPAGALRPTDPTHDIRPAARRASRSRRADERNPGRGGRTDDNGSDPSGGQGNDAGGHTHASACLLATRDAASLTPASATHRPCRAITPHTLDA